MKTHTLTLTYEERRALDWIGGRYSHGDDLSKLLWAGDGVTCQCPYPEIELDGWDDRVPVEFTLTEDAARKAKELILRDDLACIGHPLRGKLITFAEEVQ